MDTEPTKKNNKFATTATALVILVIIVGAVLAFSHKKSNNGTDQVFCTQEAKQCPDGSYVGRSGPKCDFAPCPSAGGLVIDTTGWKTVNDTATGISFKYPENIGTKYIHTADWPPVVTVTNATYSCAESGAEISQGGRTEKQNINGNEYCVTKIAEGAAGTTYTQYTFATSDTKDATKTLKFMFTLGSVQCANYDDPQKSECEAERSTFDIGKIMDVVVRSAKF